MKIDKKLLFYALMSFTLMWLIKSELRAEKLMELILNQSERSLAAFVMPIT